MDPVRNRLGVRATTPFGHRADSARTCGTRRVFTGGPEGLTWRWGRRLMGMCAARRGKRSVVTDVVAMEGPGQTGPRITFTVFRSMDDPMLRSWMRFRSPLAGSSLSEEVHVPARADDPRRGRQADAAEPGFWRLLASNNREVGRSYLLYRSFDHARAHVQQLQAEPEALATAFVSGPHNGARGWVVTFHGTPVMTCARWYDSTSARAAAASGALSALPAAHVAGVPDRSGPSGRFLRRAEQGAVVS